MSSDLSQFDSKARIGIEINIKNRDIGSYVREAKAVIQRTV
jgi:hypothetical protein